MANRVIDHLVESGLGVGSSDRVTGEILLAVTRIADARLGSGKMARPSIPLRHSELIVNGPRDLRVGREIKLELASADRVDVLMSFVMWTGFIELKEALRAFCDRFDGKPPLRVLTTTYMGATDVKALDELIKMGATVHVSYDSRRTRLHAKAWLFHRNSGFSTAIIGSNKVGSASNAPFLRARDPAILNAISLESTS